MITGAHSIVFSRKPEADRAFFLDVLQLPHVDVGQGWLIFGLPPAEVAVHGAAESAGTHELYLMCEDIDAFIAELRQRDIECSDVTNAGWGLLTQVTLPGGGKLGVYQPRHARPQSPGRAAPKRAAKKAGKKRAVKKAGKKRAVKKASKATPPARARGKKRAKKR